MKSDFFRYRIGGATIFSMTALRAFRQARKLTLDELALRSGAERKKLSRAERGYVLLLPDEVRRVARALRVRMTDIEEVMATRPPRS